MIKIMWLSNAVPYDKVGHAGGKTENYYLKKMSLVDEFQIKLVSYYKPEETDKIDLDHYGIDYKLFKRPRGGVLNEAKRGFAWVSKSFVFNRYAGLVPMDLQIGFKKMMRELKNEKYQPDVVILHWTEMVFFLPEVKKIWPNAKYIAIEEDVSYLSQRRKKEYFNNPILRAFFSMKEEKVKKLEIEYLNNCDLSVFNNRKDLNLAKKDGYCGEYLVWSVFYHDLFEQPLNNEDSKDIIFYGDMGREENWKSAIWFIENVLSLIKDKDVRFVVVGGRPVEKLKKYASEKVVITGFVDDIGEALSHGMCLVAPLVLGAGVKVKILEAFSLGIPVLTNDIGIEGIPGKDGYDYFFCKEAEDYAQVISKILDNKIDLESFSKREKELIKNTFSYEKSSKEFANHIIKIMSSR